MLDCLRGKNGSESANPSCSSGNSSALGKQILSGDGCQNTPHCLSSEVAIDDDPSHKDAPTCPSPQVDTSADDQQLNLSDLLLSD